MLPVRGIEEVRLNFRSVRRADATWYYILSEECIDQFLWSHGSA